MASSALIACGLLLLWPVAASAAEIYHLDAGSGRDGADGRSPETAWASLDRASRADLRPGDRLRLRRGQTFAGSLRLAGVQGTPEAPVTVAAYGEGDLPVIDARGRRAALELADCRHLVAEDLALTADGGEGRHARPERRYGVRVGVTEGGESAGITLRRLRIHDIYPAHGSPSEGRNPTTHMGFGIGLSGAGGQLRDVTVTGCEIRRTGFKGIEINHARGVLIEGNRLLEIGGPGLQPNESEDVVVRGNTVLYTGSSADPRMHGRGSGIWPWRCRRVLIERNEFGHARGKADSCGVHIDFGCRDVVVQYNLSHDNEGGFVEILGDCHDSAYRYNVSVNDGFRIRGQNGAHQEGKTLWTSGYTGRGNPKAGPFNSYIYNNTVHVRRGLRVGFAFAPTTEGLLIANNLFHIEGETVLVGGDQERQLERASEPLQRVVFSHNLYLREGTLPPGAAIRDARALFGDPRLPRPDGTAPGDHRPAAELVRDAGREIEALPGDTVGLRLGLAVAHDFAGQPIVGRPDIGAYEVPAPSTQP